jgi:hypothetical protein
MKAVEFKTHINNDLIQVPEELEKECKSLRDKAIRIILLKDEQVTYEENKIKSLAQEQFFQGYSESDAIYDE